MFGGGSFDRGIMEQGFSNSFTRTLHSCVRHFLRDLFLQSRFLIFQKKNRSSFPIPPTIPTRWPLPQTPTSHPPPTLLTKPRPNGLLRHPHATPMKPLIRTLLIIACHHVPIAHVPARAILPLVVAFGIFHARIAIVIKVSTAVVMTVVHVVVLT